jgi:GNAT superfamily N-acetyltransferase
VKVRASTSELPAVVIRRATPRDREAIFELVPRLVAFGPPPWREPSAMSATDRKVIGTALLSAGEDPTVLVAVSNTGLVVGFIHLHSLTDYYTERKHGHVADIVVAESQEGRGIGKRLLAEADDWARAQQFEWLTISVFQQNARAGRMYEQMGFKQDTVRLLKPLTTA